MSEGLFRKAAIDKVSSPEQLDLLMRVTSPAGWIALATVGVMLLVAGVWSVVGSIPDLVNGNGTLFRGESIYEVKAPMSGTLVALPAQQGQTVSDGQVLANLQQEELGPEKQRAAQEQLNALKADIAKNKAMVDRERATLAKSEKDLKLQKALVDQGIKAENDLFKIQREMDGARGRIEGLRVEMAASEAKMRSIEVGQKSTIAVTSTESGSVVAVLKSAGDKVSEGEPLVRIERRGAGQEGRVCDGDVYGLVYIPAASAGKVKKGDVVRVSPTGVEKERYGFIFGRVDWINGYPASTADMNGKLKNDQLVKQFSGEGPVYESRVCLEKDPGNKVSPFKWSSSQGSPTGTDAGTTCQIVVVVDQKKPYTYVIPAVKRAVGL